MKIHFLTFASSNMTEPKKRLSNEIEIVQKNTKYFSSVCMLDETNLSLHWKQKYGKYCNEHGFALWSWKPYIIKERLDELQMGDCLFYADTGCSFPLDNLDGFFSNLNVHIQNTTNSSLQIGIEPRLRPVYPNYIIIRKQILELFNLLTDYFFLQKWLHYEAGVLIIIKTPDTIKFINEWVDFFEEHFEDAIYSNFYDVSGQYNGFVHNGSDQAVFQCMLYKKINMFYSILDDIYYRYNFYARKIK